MQGIMAAAAEDARRNGVCLAGGGVLMAPLAVRIIGGVPLGTLVLAVAIDTVKVPLFRRLRIG
jgi:hypothetical protein